MSKKRKPLLGGDRDRLADYMWQLAVAMDLEGWRLKLADDPPPSPPSGEEPGGFCNVLTGRKYAVIHVAEGWATWDPEELREILTHELVHCHAAGTQFAFNAITAITTQQMYDVLVHGFTDALEHTVDGIARAWARTLPLPVKAKGAA